MRLLKLRIENINSLAGRYEIDFTNRDYVESGIFAIVGPTGSGKTTILDAVTLALFGKTPRMETRTSTSKKTDRGCMVLTEGRKQCSASVVFESMGKFWRSRWSVRLKRTGEPRDAQMAVRKRGKLLQSRNSLGTQKCLKCSGWTMKPSRAARFSLRVLLRSFCVPRSMIVRRFLKKSPAQSFTAQLANGCLSAAAMRTIRSSAFWFILKGRKCSLRMPARPWKPPSKRLQTKPSMFGFAAVNSKRISAGYVRQQPPAHV